MKQTTSNWFAERSEDVKWQCWLNNCCARCVYFKDNLEETQWRCFNHCVMLSSVQQGSVTQLVSNQISFVLLLYPEPFTRVRWLRVFLPVGHGWGGGGPYQSWLLGRAPLIYGALQLEITPRGLWDSKMQIVLLGSLLPVTQITWI